MPVKIRSYQINHRFMQISPQKLTLSAGIPILLLPLTSQLLKELIRLSN